MGTKTEAEEIGVEENISVSVRLRPLSTRERQDNQREAWGVVQDDTVRCALENNGASIAHRFDSVFGPEQNTEQVYEHIGREVVSSVLKGMNGTIFAYGQTASGKTHTMQGDEVTPGILPLAVEHIFDEIEEMQHFQFLLHVSYIEIFNEQVKDLLSDKSVNLRIREDPVKGFYVENISTHSVVSIREVLELKNQGEKRRHVGETNMNLRSSRSHTIFTLKIEMRDTRVFEKETLTEQAYKRRPSARSGAESEVDSSILDSTGPSNDENYCFGVLIGKLNLVDLAGSENAKLTKAVGDRFTEACNINRSLLSLSMVISQLATMNGESGSAFVNWRGSKLTQILQPSLGGNCKTSMICCIRTGEGYFEESKSTLGFAAKTKQIKNRVCVNEVLDGEGEIQKLKSTVKSLEVQLRSQQEANEHRRGMEEQIDRLKALLINGQTEFEKVYPNVSFKDVFKAKQKSRKTWCPGKKKVEFDAALLPSPLLKQKKHPLVAREVHQLEKSKVRKRNSSYHAMDDPSLMELLDHRAMKSPPSKKRFSECSSRESLTFSDTDSIDISLAGASDPTEKETTELKKKIQALESKLVTLTEQTERDQEGTTDKENDQHLGNQGLTEKEKPGKADVLQQKINHLEESHRQLQTLCADKDSRIQSLETAMASEKEEAVKSLATTCEVASRLERMLLEVASQAEKEALDKALAEQAASQAEREANLTKDVQRLTESIETLQQEHQAVKTVEAGVQFSNTIEEERAARETKDKLVGATNRIQELENRLQQKEHLLQARELEQRELQDMKQATIQLKAELETVRASSTVSMETSEKSVSQLTLSNSLKTQELEKLRAKLQASEKELKEQQGYTEALETKHATEAAGHMLQVQTLENEQEKLNSTLRALEVQRDNSKTRESKLQDLVAEAQSKAEELTEKLEGFTSVLKENEALSTKVEAYTSSVAVLEERCNKLREGIEEKTSLILDLEEVVGKEQGISEALKKELEASAFLSQDCQACVDLGAMHEQVVDECGELRGRVEDLQTKLVASQAAMKTLEQEKQVLSVRFHKQKEAQQQLQNEVGNVQQALYEKRDACEMAEKESSRLQAAVESLRQEMKASEEASVQVAQRQATLETELRTSEKVSSTLLQAEVQLSKELEAKGRQLEGLRAKVSASEGELEKKNRRIEKLERSKITHERATTIIEAMKQNKQLKDAVSRILGVIRTQFKVAASFGLEDVERFLLQTQEGIEKIVGNKKELEARYVGKKKRVGLLEEEVEHLKKQLDELSDKNFSLQRTVEECTAELSNLESKQASLSEANEATVGRLEKENLNYLTQSNLLREQLNRQLAGVQSSLTNTSVEEEKVRRDIGSSLHKPRMLQSKTTPRSLSKKVESCSSIKGRFLGNGHRLGADTEQTVPPDSPSKDQCRHQ